MSDLIPSPVLLAIIQNQIKTAVDEINDDTSNCAKIKHIENIKNITQSEKKDISENLYDILIDDNTSGVYVATVKNQDNWKYVKIYSSGIGTILLSEDDLKFTQFRVDNEVKVDANGNVTYSACVPDQGIFPTAQNFVLISQKYQNVTFYSNYFTNKPKPIYRFSSGVILDSSTGTPQYKIVFASYDVNNNKVTFVEKMLP